MNVAVLPWHVAVALGALASLGYVFARVQLERAKEDWANAFFYSPSQKGRQRQRRQRWQDRCWGLLAAAAGCFLVAAILYLRSPR